MNKTKNFLIQQEQASRAMYKGASILSILKHSPYYNPQMDKNIIVITCKEYHTVLYQSENGIAFAEESYRESIFERYVKDNVDLIVLINFPDDAKEKASKVFKENNIKMISMSIEN